MAKIICIVPSTIAFNDRLRIFQIFFENGFLNVVIVHETLANGIKFESITSIRLNQLLVTDEPNSKTLFADKLCDMNGYRYKIIAYDQAPRVEIINNQAHSYMFYFLNVLRTVQNSNYHLIFLHDRSYLEQYWIYRKMDLTINTGVMLEASEPKLLTYETEGYCALIPIPPKTSLFKIIFIEPFDGLTWMLFALSIVSCVAVFWIFRDRGAVDSPWLLFYGMLVYFIGQGVDFSRQNRTVLMILVQLMILMIFVLSNSYEGVISSFMIKPIHEQRLETVEDLLTSKYNILTDEIFANSIDDHNEYDAIKSRMNTSGAKVNNRFEEVLLSQRFVFVKSCEAAKYELKLRLSNKHFISDYYYLLPEKLTWFYIQLEASFSNPFLERFQYYMDLSFQAGLPQMWKIVSEYDQLQKTQTVLFDDVNFLKLDDLYQVFSILVIGYVLSSVMLLCEIFLCDFWNSLKFNYLASKLRQRVSQKAYKSKPKDAKYRRGALYFIIHRHQKTKRLRPKRLRVKQIFVQSSHHEMQ